MKKTEKLSRWLLILIVFEVLLLLYCLFFAREILIEEGLFFVLGLFAAIVLSDLLLTWTILLSFALGIVFLVAGVVYIPFHQGRTSSTYLSPQDVVAVLGKASSGEETYQEGSVGPFMTSLDYEAEGSPSSVSVLLSNMIGSRLSSLNFENLNSERLANKNGSLNREDFANIKIGTSYSDLVNTVGIPSRVSWSSMMSSESFLIFYYKLSDSRSVIIRFGSNRTISEIKGLEDPATSTSP